MSLAPWFYRNVVDEAKGPITRLEYSFGEIGWQVSGYNSAAFLIEKLKNPRKLQSILYSDADGVGSSHSRLVAQYIAISEALERWAHWETLKSQPNLFGFDLDPFSTGLAAYPSIFSAAARKRAFEEALERWGLIEWWAGKISGKWIENESKVYPRFFQINIPQTDFKLIIMVSKDTDFNFYSFGHACSRSFAEACRKAAIENARNRRVLKSFWSRNERVRPLSIIEKRLVFFSKPEGFSHFLEATHRRAFGSKLPGLVVDKELRGPWSKFAKIWRCLFPVSSFEFANEGIEDIFLF